MIGQELYRMAEAIFPLCRSITGDGVRQTLKILSDYIAQDGMTFVMHEIPSGTHAFDWTVPKEWAIRDAYIENEQGERIIDIKKNNLHVMGYSIPVDRWVTLDELKQYVYTQPDQPDVIPYVTSYYEERFGFCMSETKLRSLPTTGRYHMVIDSELFDGSLTYADFILPGESDQEIMITSYTCHPSMANNECSGPVLLAALVRYVHSLPQRRYTYRFVLNPETIGSIIYLSKNYKHLQEKMKAGVVLSCVGDDRAYSIVHSRYGNTIADRSMVNILRDRENFKEYSFLKRGSDERQYNASGIDLPVICFCRSKWEYSEYHTSADNMGLISPSGLQGSYDVMTDWIQAMESNLKYKTTVLCEPQLGKRGLYPTLSQKGRYDEVRAMKDFLAYADGRTDLIDISDQIGISIKSLLPIIEKLTKTNLLEAY